MTPTIRGRRRTQAVSITHLSFRFQNLNTPPALRADSLGKAVLPQNPTAALALLVSNTHLVGAGLRPANGAAGAPDKSTDVSVVRRTPPALRACSLFAFLAGEPFEARAIEHVVLAVEQDQLSRS